MALQIDFGVRLLSATGWDGSRMQKRCRAKGSEWYSGKAKVLICGIPTEKVAPHWSTRSLTVFVIYEKMNV